MYQRSKTGFFVDTGAPTSVIGRKELRIISQGNGIRNLKLRKSGNRFRFSNSTFQSLGQVDLPLATPCGLRPIYVTLDVVSADVPALLGLDTLD